ncbi:MAG: FecR domain-containing protein [Carboxylicivirga sp.]|jgi:ferric-dicitrate binding protein FerR (iron transport regulator)|nr:FecR domain-containing protein [Carboxylicivirga sp.]
MKSGNKHIDDQLFAKWINGSLSDKEQDKIDRWAAQSKENIEVLKGIKQLDTNVTLLNQMAQVDSKKALNNVKKRIDRQTSYFNQLLIQWQKVAAILLIPLLLYNAYHIISTFERESKYANVVWNEISTPSGLRSEFILPDGSKVWLNGNSRLRYPLQFDSEQRKVELEGEALFDVKTDKRHPFVVDVNSILVEATGTSFNVMGYPDENLIKTALIEGKVNIYSLDEGKVFKLVEMEPGQVTEYDVITKQLSQVQSRMDKYIAWREGKLLFSNDNLGEVLNKISRWYNVEFKVSEELAVNHSYTGEFSGEPLSQILQFIELTTPVLFNEVDSKSRSGKTNNKKLFIVREN